MSSQAVLLPYSQLQTPKNPVKASFFLTRTHLYFSGKVDTAWNSALVLIPQVWTLQLMFCYWLMSELPWLLHAWGKVSSWLVCLQKQIAAERTCYLLWESFASAWWLRGLKGAESLRDSGEVLCFQGGYQWCSIEGLCQCLHLNNDRSPFGYFSFYPFMSLPLFTQNFGSVVSCFGSIFAWGRVGSWSRNFLIIWLKQCSGLGGFVSL